MKEAGGPNSQKMTHVLKVKSNLDILVVQLRLGGIGWVRGRSGGKGS